MIKSLEGALLLEPKAEHMVSPFFFREGSYCFLKDQWQLHWVSTTSRPKWLVSVLMSQTSSSQRQKACRLYPALLSASWNKLHNMKEKILHRGWVPGPPLTLGRATSASTPKIIPTRKRGSGSPSPVLAEDKQSPSNKQIWIAASSQQFHQIISWGSDCLGWNKSLPMPGYSIKRNYPQMALKSQVMEQNTKWDVLFFPPMLSSEKRIIAQRNCRIPSKKDN